ncbi:hypothetical protein EWM64_g9177 [Hericium alpestre]|uniref:Retroviral polymerase SH3-like domain-containing protein n=1 Tax=Hericium alpestre TaxID=135208 RepID=A0A4Y9ZJR3_9AGAM|nr:hypothetical protein EWM64_g9177 [Hericium alpestre]
MENWCKLDPRADEGHFMGYTTDSKGIIVYWLKHHMMTVERNVIWDDSALLPVTDKPPEAWLVDLFSGPSNKEWVILDRDDAAPSDGSMPAANASDCDPPTTLAPAATAPAAPHPAPDALMHDLSCTASATAPHL